MKTKKNKKYAALFLTAGMVLTISGCSTTENGGSYNETGNLETETSTEVVQDTTEKETEVKAIDLIGPWHLADDRNDWTMLNNYFASIMEFGASMEIKSNGTMSWYIGAAGAHGTYYYEDGVLTADLINYIEETKFSGKYTVIKENEEILLVMDYEGKTIYWSWGDSTDVPASGGDTST